MERSRELRGLVYAMYRDWAAADASYIDGFSDDDDVTLIGTDPVEWYRGGREIKTIFRQQVAELGAFEIEPGELFAFVRGDVGWVVDNPTFRFPELELHPRCTVIFAREGVDWKVVHWHISFGQSNEDALGIELTTSMDALAEWADAAKPDLAPTASPDGTVTIVFTDIEGSTALNEEVGDQRWLSFIQEHDDVVRGMVRAHGGTTVKGAGDGFMLAFPSARRSIECAMALQRQVSLHTNPSVRMRVGLHTGEPLRHADDFFGRDVAYAARVGAVAAGGEILVSSLVMELCAGGPFSFDGPRMHDFKGFEGEQTVYAVKWQDA